ncbi:MAG: class I SAM-dependent methyltransferase [Candidatus Aminicenantes bacterium]|nr:class I SAM-dependent methyltransferase [Candidatus Aminicenantes bacterium]MDH5385413.1 class I SAM-dependent methyltransferase [Candidatus Aminicenantes bacterium]
MSSYYEDKLSAERLKRCYEIASPRVQQYLEAEVAYVLEKIRPGDIVLELGCGYGRILPALEKKAGTVIGIDVSLASLVLASQMLVNITNYRLLNVQAVQLSFHDGVFDCVICIQNGISAFHVDKMALVRESARVTKPGGKVLFSSYSDKFWEERLKWFQAQSNANLLGEIDYERTGNGVIVCKDGFTATTVRPHDFLAMSRELNLEAKIEEVDESSIFCELVIPKK